MHLFPISRSGVLLNPLYVLFGPKIMLVGLIDLLPFIGLVKSINRHVSINGTKRTVRALMSLMHIL